MIPISDDNPSHRRPLVSWTVIATCLLVFIWQIALSERDHELAVLSFAFTPDRLFAADADVFALLTLVTSMFLHAGLMHLGGNMLYLWVFGNNVEDAMGRARFFVFYIASGIAAALSQAWLDPA